MGFLSGWFGCLSVATWNRGSFRWWGVFGICLQEGELFIGGVILLFSVAFPVAKLAAIIRAVHLGPEASGRHLKMVESLGKWSMVDVFVIASLVICFKGFPGGTHIQVQWGIYVFAVSMVLTMLATWALKRALTSGGAGDAEQQIGRRWNADVQSAAAQSAAGGRQTAE